MANWIKSAVPKSHKGLFGAKAKAAGETTSEYASEKAHAGGKLGEEARFALTMEGVRPKTKHPFGKRYGK